MCVEFVLKSLSHMDYPPSSCGPPIIKYQPLIYEINSWFYFSLLSLLDPPGPSTLQSCSISQHPHFRKLWDDKTWSQKRAEKQNSQNSWLNWHGTQLVQIVTVLIVRFHFAIIWLLSCPLFLGPQYLHNPMPDQPNFLSNN